MTVQEWIKQFNETKETFSWFIIEHFGKFMLSDIEFHVSRGEIDKARILMNCVWFELPDSKFNIIENPKGWNEFLFLLEYELCS